MAEASDLLKRRKRTAEEDRPQNTSSTVHQPLPKFLKQEEEGAMAGGGGEGEASWKFYTSPITRWSSNPSSPPGHKGVVAVVGVGAGLGYSIAQRFVHEGYTVAILARNSARLEKFVKEIAEKEINAQLYAIRIDCSDPNEVKQAFESVRSFGFVELLVYNVSTPTTWPSPKFTDIDTNTFRQSLMLPCLGAFYCVQEVNSSFMDIILSSKWQQLFFFKMTCKFEGLPVGLVQMSSAKLVRLKECRHFQDDNHETLNSDDSSHSQGCSTDFGSTQHIDLLVGILRSCFG